MKRTRVTGLALMLMAGPCVADALTDREEARQASMALGGALKQALIASMKEGGPLAAIDVCNLSAMPITEQVSEQSQWAVARTSLKIRNPDNAPDAWEREQLEAFQAQLDAGASPDSLEVLQTEYRDGKPVQRYMKPIMVQGPCLACHGSQLSAEVTQALDTHYPQDQARGYQAGELRGAFTLERPLP
ncbi:glutamate synthase [Alcanivorax sp. 97CO-5]|uniref:Tll0287-like domain-containing protein n=1 Tax=unclassified Alcanivorax TaxID=2638842 RepID=UPI0003E7E9E7|nr:MULTISPECIES: DUF3365 domain-containing protein [unclassified Alcanivorax]EUC69846.1 glutamate synthase [Alcanivorax sp. 97CO-5]PKG01696.1 DUF3365 domain-containing protein [Alcanivorax sp. 97CO-6]